MDHHHFKGDRIPHIRLEPDMSIEDLVSMYEATGYNGRQLGIAAKTYAKMIEEDATICLTVSGAMTPLDLGEYSSHSYSADLWTGWSCTGANDHPYGSICRPLYPVASYIDTRSSILMSGSNLMWGMRSPLK